MTSKATGDSPATDGSRTPLTTRGADASAVNVKHLDIGSWLELTDIKHRYGKNLMKYYRYWLMYEKEDDDFFKWLDEGGGLHRDLPWCRRKSLEQKRVLYMSENERELFEVKITNGLLQFKDSNEVVDTRRWGCAGAWQAGMNFGSGVWIFVLSTRYELYVARKIKGRLHHSSFLAGEATIAAGNIVVSKGRLLSISPTSGHYKPSPENLIAMDNWLAACGVDISKVVWFGYTPNPCKLCRSICVY